MRTIGVVTVGRSDYSIYQSVLQLIENDPDLDLWIFVSGMHLSTEFGFTVNAIECDGFNIRDRIEMLLSSDTPEGISKSMGIGSIGFAQAFAKNRPDLLIVLGDRFEMHAAVIAALPFNIPVAHIHGGEITEGAIDNSLRHSITKLSHLHFVTHSDYARRVRQMGEEPWRITISGAPSLDNIMAFSLVEKSDMEVRLGFKLTPPPLLITYHPVTLEYNDSEIQINELIRALDRSGMPLVFTRSNADTGGNVVDRSIRQYVNSNDHANMVDNLGSIGYYSVMKYSAAMVGNSSSGIIEAPSLGLPVVNVGTRQDGRIRASNVIDVDCNEPDILTGIEKATQLGFKAKLIGLTNPYGDGQASIRIVKRLKEIELGQFVLRKKFHEL